MIACLNSPRPDLTGHDVLARNKEHDTEKFFFFFLKPLEFIFFFCINPQSNVREWRCFHLLSRTVYTAFMGLSDKLYQVEGEQNAPGRRDTSVINISWDFTTP